MSEIADSALLDDPGLQQRRAYVRDASVWVEASAGTGKTTVLTRQAASPSRRSMVSANRCCGVFRSKPAWHRISR
jgi:hypothetical protein